MCAAALGAPNGIVFPRMPISCQSHSSYADRHDTFFPAFSNSKRTSELAELSVIVVEQELRLLIEAGVFDLLLRPLEGWMIGYVQVDDLSTGNLHDDEYVKDTKPNRVLHKEVAGPHGLGLVLQKASPGLRICGSRSAF